MLNCFVYMWWMADTMAGPEACCVWASFGRNGRSEADWVTRDRPWGSSKKEGDHQWLRWASGRLIWCSSVLVRDFFPLLLPFRSFGIVYTLFRGTFVLELFSVEDALNFLLWSVLLMTLWTRNIELSLCSGCHLYKGTDVLCIKRWRILDSRDDIMCHGCNIYAGLNTCFISNGPLCWRANEPTKTFLKDPFEVHKGTCICLGHFHGWQFWKIVYIDVYQLKTIICTHTKFWTPTNIIICKQDWFSTTVPAKLLLHKLSLNWRVCSYRKRKEKNIP